MIPHWLRLISLFALVLGFAAAGVIMIDEMRHPQHMWIMNIVWPVVALFGTVLTIWAYCPGIPNYEQKETDHRSRAGNSSARIIHLPFA